MKKLLIFVTVAMLMLAFVGCSEQPGDKPTATPAPSTGASATVGTSEQPGPGATPEATPAPETIFFNAGDEYRILIWNNYAVNDYVLNNQEARAEEIKERWENMQEDYGITITYIAAPGDWIGEALSTANAGEPVCDVLHCGGPFAVPTTYNYAGIAGSVLTPLSDYPEAGNFSDPEYWDVSGQENVCTFSGKLYYAIPRELGYGVVAYNQVTFFNSELTNAAGYSDDELYALSKNGQWTFDKMREVAIACTDADKGVYGMHMGQNGCAVFAMVAANNGQYITNVDGVPTFTANTPEVIQAVDYFVRLAKDDKVVYLEGNPGSDDDHPTFVAGHHALMITYANRAPKIYLEENLDYGILMPPKGPSADDYISDSNWFTPYAVMANVANPAGCVQLISKYIRPDYAMSSIEATTMFDSELSIYTRDEGSKQTLLDVISKTRASSIMTWTSLYNSDGSMGGYMTGETLNWIKGEGSPAVHFAAVEGAANELLKQAVGLK